MSQEKQPAHRAGCWPLGRHSVARVGYGAMQLERSVGRKEDAVAVLQHAIDLGVNHIDTAEFYGGGFVNAVIAEVLRDHPDLLVATKVGADPNPGGPIPIRPAQRPEQLRASVEANLQSLEIDQLPLVNLRRLDVSPTLKAEGDQIVDIDDQLAAMIAMRDEGLIGAIGVSAVDFDRLKRAIPAGIVCVQNAYSLVSRQYEAMLELCVDQAIAWVPFFPLGGAYFPEWPKVTDHPTIVDVASRMAITPSQVGLAWLLAHRPNILLIPGTASKAHLSENIAAASVTFDDETLCKLNAVAGSATGKKNGENA